MAMDKEADQEISVGIIRTLRWSSGLTREDRIINKYIKRVWDCVNYREKMVEENRLRSYYHVIRREDIPLYRNSGYEDECKRN